MTALEELQASTKRREHPEVTGLIQINEQLIELWRAAQTETGVILTVCGNARSSSTQKGTNQGTERPPADELAAFRAFRRALRNVVIPPCLRLTDDEAREYSFAVACLDCGIQPPMKNDLIGGEF